MSTFDESLNLEKRVFSILSVGLSLSSVEKITQKNEQTKIHFGTLYPGQKGKDELVIHSFSTKILRIRSFLSFQILFKRNVNIGF